jgi:flagellar biogenesis protein FliO
MSTAMTSFTTNAASLWKKFQSGWGAHLSRPRSLILRESLSLGERRFVAVIECDGQRFLVGGGRETVQLIARLDGALPNSAEETQ